MNGEKNKKFDDKMSDNRTRIKERTSNCCHHFIIVVASTIPMKIESERVGFSSEVVRVQYHFSRKYPSTEHEEKQHFLLLIFSLMSNLFIRRRKGWDIDNN